MNREKPYFLRRAGAYLIDLIIVTLLAGIISNIAIKNDDYQIELQKQVELLSNYNSGNITKEEYNLEMDNVTYYLSKNSIGINIITISISIAYYVVLCYFCGGITLGKQIMRLGIVSANDKKLNLGNFLLRSLLVNSILLNLSSVILVSVLNKESFITIYSKLSSVLSILLLVSVAFIVYREDGRGLHDLIANTKVISTKTKKEETKEIPEAKVIEEKTTKKKKKENGDK